MVVLQKPPPSIRSSTMDTEQDEGEALHQIVSDLTVAMTELQQELRDKHAELEATQAIANTLSEALQDSEEMLYQKTIECEQLGFKLQGVTFVDAKDSHETKLFVTTTTRQTSSSFGAEKDSKKKKSRKKKKDDKKKKKSRKNKGDASSASDAESDSEYYESDTEKKKSSKRSKNPTKKKKRAAAKNPIDLDELMDAMQANQRAVQSTDNDKKPAAAVETVQDMAMESFPATAIPPPQQQHHEGDEHQDDDYDNTSNPRQAAFYRVMAERDSAQMQARLLAARLERSEDSIRHLQARLNKSTALIELSYARTFSQDNGDDYTTSERKDESHRSSSFGTRPKKVPLRWLLKGTKLGESLHEDPKRWSMHDIQDLPEQYFEPFTCSSDADRAAGFNETRLEV